MENYMHDYHGSKNHTMKRRKFLRHRSGTKKLFKRITNRRARRLDYEINFSRKMFSVEKLIIIQW